MTSAATGRVVHPAARGRPAIDFAVRFVVIVGLLAAAYGLFDPEPFLIAATARLTEWGSLLVGLWPELLEGSAQAVPVSFDGGRFTYQITSICTGATVAILFSSAIMAFPANWRQRLTGIAVGLCVITALNIARLVSLGWVGLHARGLFDQIHLYWYQAFLIVSVGLGWLVWLTLVVRSDALSVGTRDRLRSLGTAAALFTATFVAVVSLGALLGAPRAYARLLSSVLLVVGGFVYYDPNVRVDFGAGASLTAFATLAAIVGLYVAVHSIPWMSRLRALATRGLSVTFAAHAAAAFAQYAIIRDHPPVASWLSEAVALAGTVIPLTVWFLWVRTDRVPTRKTSR